MEPWVSVVKLPNFMKFIPNGRGVSVVLLLLAMALFGQWLADPSVTPLKVARIEGDLRYLKRSDLETAVAKATQGGFFTVNVQAIKDAAESLPWVAKVSVRRVWPDAIHIWVVEQSPVARWGDKSLINPEGEVFTPSKKLIPEGLPKFVAPENSGKDVVGRYRLARRELQKLNLAIAQMRLSQRRAWSLVTKDGLVLQLGVDDFDSRIKRFVKVYPRLKSSSNQKMNEVDMRYANGMAVKWAKQERPEPKESAS